MQQLLIRTMQQHEMDAWDAYVDQHSQGSFFHLSGWQRIAREVFGHTPHYLVALDHDAIVGVLPLVEQKSRLFGHALISTPFCVYGGILSNDESIREALEDKSVELGHQLGVDFVELRDRYAAEIRAPWQIHCKHVTIGCDIAESPDAILAGVKKKQRAVLRHSMKNELSFSVTPDADTCYDIYAESVRNLGTPVFTDKLFSALMDVFPERSETLVVRNKEQKAVSAVLSFYYKNQVLPYYGGGLFEARGLKSNDYMYYQLMCHAQTKGCDYFDFGRSKLDSGSYKYKKHWGMPEQTLHYRFALIKADALPNLSPNNPKYKLLINTWQKLPVFISRMIGPMISKYLG
ncbi:FemAB family XrtA/PEP-CTERM system-associated protein [Echinimonas agarilytica]|uniref:FemAB family PEP-CTERM system-associated protein n=1 Tax=Echinimonas agarilytica TaxID=1215918 RepID=A0AA42B9J9_9GAMM|nr:FemAB family XrtA/PEP-CTERM system-associated protein [Echinimonas agarilytica]MCM2681472.1 FemAB family PEP-CTERM system-associated protein [Echinimonas agarilytica]